MIPDARAIEGVGLRFTWLRDNFVDGPPLDAEIMSSIIMLKPISWHWLGVSYFLISPGLMFDLFVLPQLRDLKEVDTISWATPS